MKIKFKSERLEKWLEERSSREALLIYLAGFALIYLFWNILIEWPLRHERESQQSQNEKLVKQLETQKENLAKIEKVIASASFSQSLQKHEEIRAQFLRLSQEFQKIQATVIPVSSLTEVTNQIIARPVAVSLVSLKTFPSLPWLDTAEAKQSLPNLQAVEQENMELEFRGTYFDVLGFFSQLEKLPWHLYWDHLDYQVLSYPEAKVVARFYVLSEGKG